jgi:predicted component of type VI protein secretion system
MVQLQVLTGGGVGEVFNKSRLPLTIGRSAEADVTLEEPGVWPSHCTIHWRREGMTLEVEPGAFVSVNSVPVTTAVLRNGDTITLGAANLRFGFSPVRQSSIAWREWLTWMAFAALCAGQIALVYRLEH